MEPSWSKVRKGAKGRIKGDRALWFIIVLLTMFSSVIVYSATGKLAFNEADGKTYVYLFKHLLSILCGFGAILFIVNVTPIKFYSRLANTALVASVAFQLLATFQHHVLHTATNRSVSLGLISFQPAEMAKIALVIFVAKIFSTHREGNYVSDKGFKKVMIASFVVIILIALGDSSTAAILAFAVFIMMIIAGVRVKVYLTTLAIACAVFGVLITVAPMLPAGTGRVHTVRERLIDFTQGDDHEKQGTTQRQYAQLAIYEGGITPFGKGIGNNDVSNYIEAAYSDFIFAIIVEEAGVVAAILILLAYLIILFRGGKIAVKAKRSFASFLVAGIVLMYTIQAFMNMFVAVGSFPVTGQPLPFLSYGGTSMVFTSIAFGIVLMISESTKEEPAPPSKNLMVINDPDEDEELK
ncbi:MAG: FtsW/RodA/SpoVE family cell cycle protein [Mangrovibacterium sp.]